MTDKPTKSPIPSATIRRNAIAISIVALAEFAVCVVFVVSLLPQVAGVRPAAEGVGPPVVNLFGSFDLSLEAAYIGIVIAFGGLGSCIHTLTSLATYIGNGAFRPRWTMWYIVRLPVGVALALLFYALLRGGLLTSGTVAVVNPYAIAAAAGLAGLFSKQATDKLEQVFSTIFQGSPGDTIRKDKPDEDV